MHPAKRRDAYRFLAYPALAWYFFFLILPLLMVFAVSFFSRGTYGGLVGNFSLSGYARLFSAPIAVVFVRTILFAGTVALICTILGFFSAWTIAAASEARRRLWLALIVLPFLTNGLIRIVGLKTLVGTGGPVQTLLTALAVPFDPFVMTANPWLVGYGMVATYLPFTILPLYGAFEKFDFSLVEAAQDLGASSARLVVSVVVPVLKVPMIQAFLLVFIPCLGEFAIPDLLGGAKTTLIGNLITEQFLRARDWPFGAAISIALFALLGLTWGLARIWIGRRS